MKHFHVLISGEVQGVGYRQFVRSLARKNGIFGWVRNLPDGRVEAVLQGERERVDNLLKHLKKGPFLARVKNMEMNWEDTQEIFEEFVIR